MALQNITFTDKSTMNANADIPAVNKVQATDMNEIKSVVNNNANAINDYVIDQGTQTAGGVTWTYIKWNSGRAEILGYKPYSGLSMTSQSAGTYYGTGTSGSGTATLPFSLSTVLYIGRQETSPRSSGVYVYDTSINGTTLTTQFRAFASSSNVSCAVNYHIVGKI